MVPLIHDMKTGKPKKADYKTSKGEPLRVGFTGCGGASICSSGHLFAGGKAKLGPSHSAVGYIDYSRGTAGVPLGGVMRPHCSNNWIPADGTLCAPFTVSCVCSFPLRSSVALVHDPEGKTE